MPFLPIPRPTLAAPAEGIRAMASTPRFLRLPLLVLLAASWARAGISIVPHSIGLPSGGSFRFQVQGQPDQAPEEAKAESREERKQPAHAWRWTVGTRDGGAIDADTGAYTAPQVAGRMRMVRVRVTSTTDPRQTATAEVLVFPHTIHQLVQRDQGKDALVEPAVPAGVPFLRRDTGRRQDPRATVQDWTGQRPLKPRDETAIFGGVGQPLTLRWDPFPGARAQILSYWDGERYVERDVSGQSSVTVTSTGFLRRVEVEQLAPEAGRERSWRSRTVPLEVLQQGLAPLPATRTSLQAPFGLAAATESRFPQLNHRILVSEPDLQVLRLVGQDGSPAAFPCGAPGQPGFVDGPGDQARFRHPTYLMGLRRGLRRKDGSITWRCYVVDRDNHALRLVDGTGHVATFAGTGEPGWLDGPDPRKAQFNQPAGIAGDPEGVLYLADTGNRVVREIDGRTGAVGTVAGVVGKPGTRDGRLEEAQFTDLRGIATFPRSPGVIYVLDGNALRRVDTFHHTVTTLLGSVADAGFRDAPARGVALPFLQPCLREPTQIMVARGNRLWITDTGNQALREYDPSTGELRTLAGDPSRPATRAGLLRAGIPAGDPVDGRYGGLHKPLGLVQVPDPRDPWDNLWLACGPDLVKARDTSLGAWLGRRLLPLEGKASAAEAGNPVVVKFQMPVRDSRHDPMFVALRYTLECFDPGGALASRREGDARSSEWFSDTGRFTRKGTGRLRLQVVLETGDTVVREWPVQVTGDIPWVDVD